MELQGESVVAASREAVWAAINDADVLRAIIPGCLELSRTSPHDYDAVVQVKVGPLKAKFKGAVRLEDVEPPQRCRIVGEGQGGVAGFAKGAAAVELRETGGATLVSYRVEAAIGGKLAQIGSRMVKGVAAKLAAQFFDNLSAHFDGGPLSLETAAEAT